VSGIGDLEMVMARSFYEGRQEPDWPEWAELSIRDRIEWLNRWRCVRTRKPVRIDVE
jgi:hypothetical protein